jgi:hypothetical protein
MAVGNVSESVTGLSLVVTEMDGEGEEKEGEERKGVEGGRGQSELPKKAAGEPHSIPQAACTSE